ncbi:hypothetical protein CWC11_20385 [Pseudoalteromonas sp. S3178]|uniref:hypothetical protein n=1 Tax=Pseudoalteromonas sp. S3178 TaxID=579532 RepID=UPI00110BA045|nr:hypothetical protein [Pseudoalteromonas sp. S3178]TMP01958.1 hypothetical protein CWC11_20385 [Pseudoalteromonas sp. S3178]|tara:strand:- start:2234 stop:2611 length:378 start_codon:yes stop_codon:yes gene_type:complete
MNNIKNILVSIFSGIALAIIGSYLTGHTSALVMPVSFGNLIWAWDIFVVQLLGFGLLAIASGFLVAYITNKNFLFSVVAVFLITQLYLSFVIGDGFYFYFPHILTMLVCLCAGWYVARKKFCESL